MNVERDIDSQRPQISAESEKKNVQEQGAAVNVQYSLEITHFIVRLETLSRESRP